MGFKEHLNMTSVLSSHFSPALNAWPSCSRFGCKLLLLDFCGKIRFLLGLLCSISWALQTDLIPRQPKHPVIGDWWLVTSVIGDWWLVIGAICDWWLVIGDRCHLEEDEGSSLLRLNCVPSAMSLCYLGAETDDHHRKYQWPRSSSGRLCAGWF